jgi:hypothetical protein
MAVALLLKTSHCQLIPLSLEFLGPPKEEDRVPRIEREDLEALSLVTMLSLVAMLVPKKARSRKKVQCAFTPVPATRPVVKALPTLSLSPVLVVGTGRSRAFQGGVVRAW